MRAHRDYAADAERVTAYMRANPYASRSRLMKDLKLSHYAMAKIGELVPLPLKQSSSIGGSLSAARARREGKVFRIGRKP